MTARPTNRQLELIEVAVESAARACTSAFSPRADPLGREYLQAGRAVNAWCLKASAPGAGKVLVELTALQLDALIGACVDADSLAEDALAEDGVDGNRARAAARVRDRAVAALIRARRDTPQTPI